MTAPACAPRVFDTDIPGIGDGPAGSTTATLLAHGGGRALVREQDVLLQMPSVDSPPPKRAFRLLVPLAPANGGVL